MTLIRWGIIGCGAVTEIKSGPAFYKTEQSQLYGVTRRNTKKAEDYAARHNVSHVYADAESLINDNNIDAIYIATPPSSHLPLALKVANAGKPCCVEKPMAISYQECRQMLSAFEQTKQPLFVAYYRRSLPRFLHIKQWLESEKIGQVRQMTWQFCKPPSDWDLMRKLQWRTDPAISGGGYFMDLACHGLNLFEFLLGDIIDATGLVSNQQKLYEAEDAISGSWLFANGVIGSGNWNFAAFDRIDQVQIIGEKGRIVFSVFQETAIRLESKTTTEVMEIAHPENIQFFHVHNMNEHLRQNSVHPSLGQSAAQTSWVMDRILGRL